MLKPIPGFESYRITESGEIIGPRGRAIKSHKQNWGYALVHLSRDGQRFARTVHRLVMLAFVGPCPSGHQVNHKDGDKTNNCLSNLEYVTESENHAHAIANGLRPKRYRSRRAIAKADAE